MCVRANTWKWVVLRAIVGCVICCVCGSMRGQETMSPEVRAARFLGGRVEANGAAGAVGLNAARVEHLGMASGARALPRLNPLSAAWTAVGPGQVASQRYGTVTGRVTGVAIDPADATGNTVYVGTTGGGVWKSVNAAGAAGSVVFTPLTDVLPVFSANAGGVAIPSLSIGAVTVGPTGVLLAGTGDPNDATDSYYGEGVLRSVDGGLTWTLAQQSNDGVYGNHTFVGMGVAGFAWSGTSPGEVVAAMSQSLEGAIVNSPNAAYRQLGLYYSLDAGVTWKMATIEDGSQVVENAQSTGGGNAATAVVWNQARQRFFAAVRSHGYYESLDGVIWTRLAHQPATGLTTAACPTLPGTAGGASTCPIFRGALAVQAGTGDTFALTVDANNIDQGLWQDVCGLTGGGCGVSPIAFGTRLSSTALEMGSGSAAIAQGDYALSLAAVASGTDTLVFVGTTDLYRCSLAAGCVLRNTTNAVNGCGAPAKVSPSQHAIATLVGSGLPLVYVGNDGGVWRSVDGVNQQQTPCSADDANHFQNLNAGLGSLAEVVSFAQHPTDAGTVLVGLGANGTASSAGVLAGAWAQVSGGEGGEVAIDQTNPQNWYASLEAGVSVGYCGKGAACAAADFAGSATVGYGQVANDASVVYAPFVLDPALQSDVAIGTCRVWRGPGQSGASWPGGNAISTQLGGSVSGVCTTGNALVRSLGAGGPASGVAAAQDAGSTVLYAGMAGTLDGGLRLGGHVFANYAAGSAGGSTVWTDAAKGTVTNDVADAGVFNPGGFDVSSVVADGHDATGKTVYATVMGFGVPHVYRSVDGGGHWLNVSGNLPNAPANAVVVDPNDANTVYVAMDTGVYVTSSVTSCATANCWSVYGAGLPNAPVTGMAAAAAMATGDGRFGELRVGTYGRGIWGIPLLTAAYPAAPVMGISPGSLTFAAQAVGTASAAQTVTVTNTGTAALSVTSIVTSGDFTETSGCVGSAVAVGASCTVQVSFLPAVTGTRTAVLTVYGNVAGGQGTVSLTGVGTTAAAVVLNPIAVTFAGTNVGQVSAVQNVTISNTGGIAATLGTPVVTGDFKITANTCGPTLGPSVGCTVSVAFAPTVSGARNGMLTVTDSAGTQTASLSGTGVLAATDGLSPLTLTFGAQALNTASATQAVTLTNAGDAALTLIAATISSGDFTVVNGCGNSLNGHASCTLGVGFVPKNVGAETGVLTVSDQFRTQTVALNGVGVAPAGVSVAPVGGLTFAATGVGITSAGQTVTLTNNGGLPLSIASVVVSGDFVIIVGTNTCGATLAAGVACSVGVAFAPTAGGVRTGTLTVVDNAAGSPQTVALGGVGVDFALTANGATTVSVAAGGQAVFPLLLSSVAGVPGTVTMTCAGAPAHTTCGVNPATAGLGGTTTVSVTVLTNTAEMRSPFERPMVWLAGLVPFGLMMLRRRRGVWLLGLVLLAGCGASRIIPETQSSSPVGGGTPTASGTYNLTVTGTSAGLSRSVGLVLVVQ